MNVRPRLNFSSLKLGSLRVSFSCAALAVGILVGSSISFAKVTVTGLTGYSNYIPDATKPTIFGGMVTPDGSSTPTGGDGITTVNTCNTTTVGACNPTSIYPTLNLTFTITFDTAKTGTLGAALNSTSINLGTTAMSYAAGTAYTVSIPWSSICAAAGDSASSSCLKSIGLATLYVGISTGNNQTLDDSAQFNIAVRTIDATSSAYQYASAVLGTNSSGTALVQDKTSWSKYCDPTNFDPQSDEGVYAFQMYPGDGKAYMVNYCTVDSTYPNTGTTGVPYYGVRVFYSSVGYSDLSPKSSYADLLLNNSSGASTTTAASSGSTTTTASTYFLNTKVSGLTNGTKYYFMIANLDAANNLTYFSSPTYLADSQGTTVDDHSSTPAQVVGLLDDQKCFIATAAYGSWMSPEVVSFRQFRNRFLLPYSFGKKIVHFYYDKSPPLAQYIAQHETLRSIARGVLFLPLLVVKLTLFSPILSLMLFGSGAIFFILRKRSKGART